MGSYNSYSNPNNFPGFGGSGYTFEDTFRPGLVVNNNGRGAVSAAKSAQPSMADTNIARAKAAYDAVLASLATNPAYNQSAMFPGLDLSGYTQYTPAQTGSYGAGRFTGGLLNAPSFNFNAPSK